MPRARAPSARRRRRSLSARRRAASSASFASPSSRRASARRTSARRRVSSAAARATRRATRAGVPWRLTRRAPADCPKAQISTRSAPSSGSTLQCNVTSRSSSPSKRGSSGTLISLSSRATRRRTTAGFRRSPVSPISTNTRDAAWAAPSPPKNTTPANTTPRSKERSAVDRGSPRRTITSLPRLRPMRRQRSPAISPLAPHRSPPRPGARVQRAAVQSAAVQSAAAPGSPDQGASERGTARRAAREASSVGGFQLAGAVGAGILDVARRRSRGVSVTDADLPGLPLSRELVALPLCAGELLLDVAEPAPLRELSLILRRQGPRALDVSRFQCDLEFPGQRIFSEVSLRRQAPIERVGLRGAHRVTRSVEQVPEHHGGHGRVRVIRIQLDHPPQHLNGSPLLPRGASDVRQGHELFRARLRHDRVEATCLVHGLERRRVLASIHEHQPTRHLHLRCGARGDELRLDRGFLTLRLHGCGGSAPPCHRLTSRPGASRGSCGGRARSLTALRRDVSFL